MKSTTELGPPDNSKYITLMILAVFRQVAVRGVGDRYIEGYILSTRQPDSTDKPRGKRNTRNDIQFCLD